MSTYFLTEEEAQKQAEWWVVDATDLPVGRIASRVAHLIRGKHKVTWTPHTSCGDFVVVVNADKAVLTGNKGETKLYRQHSSFIGGLKEVKAGEMLAKHPERVIQLAVKGMLPEGVLGHQMNGKLKVYRGSEHPHVAQMPKQLVIEKTSSRKKVE